jgi:hypothetical protein
MPVSTSNTEAFRKGDLVKLMLLFFPWKGMLGICVGPLTESNVLPANRSSRIFLPQLRGTSLVTYLSEPAACIGHFRNCDIEKVE